MSSMDFIFHVLQTKKDLDHLQGTELLNSLIHISTLY